MQEQAQPEPVQSELLQRTLYQRSSLRKHPRAKPVYIVAMRYAQEVLIKISTNMMIVAKIRLKLSKLGTFRMVSTHSLFYCCATPKRMRATATEYTASGLYSCDVSSRTNKTTGNKRAWQ